MTIGARTPLRVDCSAFEHWSRGRRAPPLPAEVNSAGPLPTRALRSTPFSASFGVFLAVRRSGARLASIAAFALLTSGCQPETRGAPEAACPTLCARLSRACSSIDRAACEASCATSAALSRAAGCPATHARWLECALSAPLTCRSVLSGSRLSDHDQGRLGYPAVHLDYRRCNGMSRELVVCLLLHA